MADYVLILGAGVMQGPAIRAARARGFQVVVADADPNAPCAAEADRFEQVDLKDKEAMEDLARRLRAEGTLSGVFTAGTDFSATVAWVAERLGLPGIPYEVALDASDKARMRQRFKAAGVPSPDFVVVSSVGDDFLPPFSFPVVVKPVDNMGSRGCRRADNREELKIALSDALRYSRSGRAIVEQFMDGPEFSVDSLVIDGHIEICGLADRHIFFPPYFIEMGHTIPSALSSEDRERLLDTFKAAVKALGITSGAAKGDVKLTPSGPMIGEIAARLSGGYMSGWTYPLCSGVDLTAAALALATGARPLGLIPTLSRTTAERAFISIPGTVRSIHGTDSARATEGVRELFMRVSEGTSVRFPENNVSKCGNIIAVADDRPGAIDVAERAARSILIRLEAGVADTDAFLAVDPGSVASFPPDAYQATSAILSALSALPESRAAGGGQDQESLHLVDFPEFLGSGLRDYQGRGVEESLSAVAKLLDRPLVLVPQAQVAAASPSPHGRGFWRAFLRGGYQGALYYLDSIGGSRR